MVNETIKQKENRSLFFAFAMIGITTIILYFSIQSVDASIQREREEYIESRTEFWIEARDRCRNEGSLWRETPNPRVPGGFTGECWDQNL